MRSGSAQAVRLGAGGLVFIRSLAIVILLAVVIVLARRHRSRLLAPHPRFVPAQAARAVAIRRQSTVTVGKRRRSNAVALLVLPACHLRATSSRVPRSPW
ncbi:hypothetical protein [Sorangium sp. So ce1000]|uniref:hypothetical protein n=1 Tax=Sorangium sp. So ce1000 TaxID=3133325 RepID=UPI003F6326A2